MGEASDSAQPHSWSTRDVVARNALAYWTEAVCDRFLELEIEAPTQQRFSARLDQVQLGPSTLSLLTASSKRVRRTASRITRSRHSGYILLHLRSGQQALRHLGQEIHLRSGDCVFINSAEPYELECPRFTSAVALHMPEDWLRRWLPDAQDCAARLIRGTGWGAALRAAIGSLNIETCGQLTLPPAVISEQIAALLALAVGDRPVARSHGLMAALVRTLRERLEDADLSPVAVAAAHGISRRTLYYTFAAAHTTFARQLTQLRLNRAQEILRDPRLAELPIEAIAARCGFADPSHFSRRFRQQFGQPPLQFRRAFGVPGAAPG